VQNFIMLSTAVHELSTVHWISDNLLSIANIGGTDQAIDKRKTALATTIFSTSNENNFVVPLTKK